MQVKPDQLAASLAKRLHPLYTVHGDDALLTQEACDAIRAAARAAGHSERHVFTVSGAHFDWGSVVGAAQSTSLFSDKQIIEIRVPSGKPGKEGSAALQQLCEALSDDVVTLVHLPRLDGQQSKSAWFLALDAKGISVRVEPVDRRALPAWLAKRLASQSQRVQDGIEGERTLDFVADRVEGHLLAAHQELSKLALLYPAGVLTYAQVEASVLNVARYDVTKLTEAVFAGQVARALRVLDGLQAEDEPLVFMLWTLAEDLRALKRVRDAMGLGKAMAVALGEQRLWSIKERLYEKVLPRLSEHQLAHLVEAASVCDGIIKGLPHPDWPSAPWAAMRRLVLMMLDAMAAPPKASAGGGARHTSHVALRP